MKMDLIDYKKVTTLTRSNEKVNILLYREQVKIILIHQGKGHGSAFDLR